MALDLGIINTLKEMVGLMQKIDNIELYRKMLDLQSQVITLFEENRSLKETLSVREQLKFRKNAYWLGADGPFCSRCWDTDGKLVRLHTRKGFISRCPGCAKEAVDPDMPPPPQRPPADSDYLRRRRR